MNILHVNASDLGGGAARSAYQIHRSLVIHGAKQGLKSRMRVIYKNSDDPAIIGGVPDGHNFLWRRMRPRLIQQVLRGISRDPNKHYSLAWLGKGLGSELTRHFSGSEQNILNLHWIGDYQGPGDTILSIEEIAQLRQPIVWTLHDMWPFCGAEHNPSDFRWRDGYQRENRPAHERGFDLNRWNWERKRKCWSKKMHIVCPSQWLADCVQSSALMCDWPVSVVPNPIDTNIWKPIDRQLARYLLDLPQDCPILLFGAIGGSRDPNKGFDLLLDALRHIRSDASLQSMQLVVFGQLAPQSPPKLGFQVHYMGHLHDDLSLRAIYSAADVMVIPSRIENLPNTGLEAHACGTPVVAFATGGLADVVDDCKSGALAKPFDPASLAASIRWVLEDPLRRHRLGSAARQRAEQLWNPARISTLYAEVYNEALRLHTHINLRKPLHL